MTDNINHPSHYTDGKYETIDFIERNLETFYAANIVKYITRAGKKSKETEVEDLEKARWYLERYIDSLTNPPGDPFDVFEFAKDKGLDVFLGQVLAAVFAADVYYSPELKAKTLQDALRNLNIAIDIREGRDDEF